MIETDLLYLSLEAAELLGLFLIWLEISLETVFLLKETFLIFFPLRGLLLCVFIKKYESFLAWLLPEIYFCGMTCFRIFLAIFVFPEDGLALDGLLLFFLSLLVEVFHFF